MALLKSYIAKNVMYTNTYTIMCPWSKSPFFLSIFFVESYSHFILSQDSCMYNVYMCVCV